MGTKQKICRIITALPLYAQVRNADYFGSVRIVEGKYVDTTRWGGPCVDFSIEVVNALARELPNVKTIVLLNDILTGNTPIPTKQEVACVRDHTYVGVYAEDTGFFLIDPSPGQFLYAAHPYRSEPSRIPYDEIFVGTRDELITLMTQHGLTDYQIQQYWSISTIPHWKHLNLNETQLDPIWAGADGHNIPFVSGSYARNNKDLVLRQISRLKQRGVDSRPLVISQAEQAEKILNELARILPDATMGSGVVSRTIALSLISNGDIKTLNDLVSEAKRVRRETERTNPTAYKQLLNEAPFILDLSKVDLSEMNLAGLYLGEICSSNFLEPHRSNLRGANLRRADLRPLETPDDTFLSTLSEVDLCNADLREADLRCLNLEHANLQGADLRGADLNRTLLYKADLRGAKGVMFLDSLKVTDDSDDFCYLMDAKGGPYIAHGYFNGFVYDLLRNEKEMTPLMLALLHMAAVEHKAEPKAWPSVNEHIEAAWAYLREREQDLVAIAAQAEKYAQNEGWNLVITPPSYPDGIRAQTGAAVRAQFHTGVASPRGYN